LKGVPALLDALDVNPTVGLNPKDFAIRDAVFGSNYRAPMKRTPFCKLVASALDDFMLKLLIVCAFFSIGIDVGFAEPAERSHAWIEGFAILVAVSVVSLVSAGSDYQKEGQFLKQQALEENSKVLKIMREGKEEVVHRNWIRVGDIIKIENGMNIPVDGVVLEAVGIMCDESAMTGESDHLPKDTLDKCLYRRREHEADPKFEQTPHEVPSPVLLSGTQI
jgi:magnesium-transporting ATPase (P-type)